MGGECENVGRQPDYRHFGGLLFPSRVKVLFQSFLGHFPSPYDPSVNLRSLLIDATLNSEPL